MKNIHVLPTDKPSRLWKNNLLQGKLVLNEDALPFNTAQNIYITSDEEIKEDYVFAYGVVIKVMMFDVETLYFVNGTKAKREDCKKIILTDNQDLIKDGVQAIDDDFLEWFVKNPSCEFVEVSHFNNDCRGECGICDNSCGNWYKIIIPKEEPKQECSGDILNCINEKCHCKHIKILNNKKLKEEPKQDLEKEMFELEQELGTPSHLRWHNSKPKQETLEDKLQSLVVKWHQLQLHYQDVADDNITDEHTNRKFTYKAIATRDCWKELLTLLNEFKYE